LVEPKKVLAQMAIDLSNYDLKSRKSVMAFWGNREKARQKQVEAGIADQGERY